MKQTEASHEHEQSAYKIPNGMIGLFFFGLFLFVGCFPLILEIISLFAYVFWPGFGARSLLRFLYLPQAGLIALAVIAIVAFAFAIKNHSLHKSNTYTPLLMLILYGSVLVLTSRLILEYSIHTKIENVENIRWTEAMLGRALDAYPTGMACRLSPRAVAMIREWSFVTPDGHMPAFIWTEGFVPDPDLIGNPTSCTALRPNWYGCYLTKPYQLIFEDYRCG